MYPLPSGGLGRWPSVFPSMHWANTLSTPALSGVLSGTLSVVSTCKWIDDAGCIEHYG